MKTNEVNKLGKRKLFLLIYGIVIVLILLFIMFFAPNKWFQKEGERPKIESLIYTLDEQKEHLLNKQYEYEYNILYADTISNYTYKCNGKLNKEEEKGTCSLPEKIEYDETNKENVLGNLNDNYLNVEKLFDIIKDVSYSKEIYEGTIVYIYNLKINGLETNVELYSNYDDIFEIRIDNVNDHYQLKYSNIVY